MKNNLVALAAVLAATSLAVHAVEFNGSANKINPATMPQTKPVLPPLRGGIYEVQPQLQAVDAATASGPVAAFLGGKAIVRTAPINKAAIALIPGTVVKNNLTGELAYYSGNMVVLLKKREHLATLQQRYGLDLVRTGGNDTLVLLKAAPGTDLKRLKASIEASGWVQAVKLDLVDKRQVPY